MSRSIRNGVGLLTCALLAQAIASGTAVAQVGTYGAWSTTTRNNIAVYFCPDTFTNFINLGTVPLRENIKQALADWTAYSTVDIAMTYAGDLPGTTQNGCAPNQYYNDGTIVIRAENSKANGALAAVDTGMNPISKQSVAFYAKDASGNPFSWSLDSASATAYAFREILLHELGHTIGLLDYYSGTPATRMYGIAAAKQWVLWDADFAALRSIYNLQGRTIKHMRSTDMGTTWAAEGNVTDTSNNRVAVAYDSTRGRYVVAWTGSNWAGNLNTMVGNGATFSDKVTFGDTSHFGPALAYGNGLFVTAYVSTTDTRHILYKTSSDGISWGGYSEVAYAGGASYGSMWEPVLAYNASQNTFVLAWADFPEMTSDDNLGVIKFCTSTNPSTVPFGNCSSTLAYGIRTAAAPGLACHGSTNQCLLTWTNHNGVNSNRIGYNLANVDSSGLHLSNSSYGGDYTKLTPSVGFAQGKFLMGWLGVESPAGYFVPESTYPQWSGLKIAVGSSPPMNVAPTMVYGTAWSEVAYYYLTR